jgi:hypothetical protein
VEYNSILENVLIDIQIDIQNEILNQCKKCNLDDLQTDIINENVISTFNLNKQKYIKQLNKTSETLLKRYIKHIKNHEGIDYIDNIHDYSDDVHFSEEEIKLLETLSND